MILRSDSHITGKETRDLRVAFLTHSLSPHSLPLWEHIGRGFRQFRVFVSSESDAQHKFPKMETGLDVRLQRSFNRFRFFIHYYGSWESEDFHLPYDTYQQLQQYRPELIVSNQFGLRTTLSVLYRMRHPGVKLIVWATLSCRSERRRGWHRILLRRWILRHADGVFANGRSAEEYVRRLGFQGPVDYVHYAVEGLHFENEKYAPQAGRIRLLFTGRLVPQKGLRTFCRVLDRWCAAHPTTHVEMRFVGEGREEEFLRTMPTQPNLTIEVHPKVTQAGLREHYAYADIFAMPTLSDEWAVVTNEALHAGLPVLGSVQAQSVLELVREGENGWAFDLLSEESTYAGFDRALSATPEQLRSMSVKAKQSSTEFTPGRMAERALRFITALYQTSTGAYLRSEQQVEHSGLHQQVS